MYSDYTVDDVLETSGFLEQSVEQTWKEYCQRRDTFRRLCLDQINQIKQNEELQCTVQQRIKNEYAKQEQVRLSIEKNKDYLANLQKNINRVKESILQKETELLELEKEVKNMKDIDMKKKIILAYKLLTKTSFVYTTKKVTGIVKTDPPQTFTFSPQELSEEEITQKLWQLILKDKK